MYQVGYINGINDLLKRIESICGCPYLDCQNTKGNNCNECVEFTVEYSSISDAADELKEKVNETR